MSLASFLCLCALTAAFEGASVPPPIDRGPSDAPQVAFTVNVVWGTEHVLPMARAFADHGSKATFMLGGVWAQNHPTEARTLRSLGMEIASHGHRHRHVGNLDLSGNLEEIDLAQAAIKTATGAVPSLYAPAYGELSPAVLRAASERHLRVVMWTIDTIDWRPWHTPDIIQKRVLDRLTPGAIILIHPTDRTATAIGPLLEALKARGYRATTVSDLLRGRLSPSRTSTRPSSHGRDQVEYVAIRNRALA